MVAVKGYFKNKTFHSESDIAIPDGQPVIVTILDFPTPPQEAQPTVSESQRQRELFREAFDAIQAVEGEELGEEFDKVLAQGLTFRDIDFS
jgi:hypothetical protein